MDLGLRIERWEAENDGELNEVAMYRKLNRRVSAVNWQKLAPGSCYLHPPHDRERLMGIVCSSFEMEICGLRLLLRPGDILHIPPGLEHKGRVLGEEALIQLNGHLRAVVYVSSLILEERRSQVSSSCCCVVCF